MWPISSVRLRGYTSNERHPGASLSRVAFAARAVIVSFLLTSIACAQAVVIVGFNAGGLTSLPNNGTQFLSDGTSYLKQVTFQNSAGSTFSGSTSGTVTFDRIGETETRPHSWGTIVSSYAVTCNRFNITVTVNNLSSAASSEIWLQPISLTCGRRGSESSGQISNRVRLGISLFSWIITASAG